MDDGLDNWFKREVLAHEAGLVRYLNRVWPRRDEIDDLRQEIYIKLYDAAHRARPVSPRAFLFATARHLMSDRLRRRRIVSIEAASDMDFSNSLIDEISPERRIDSRQQLKLLAQALNTLPPKCREVIWMRRIDQLSQQEVARRLGISVRTVESHILKGMRLLAQAFLSGQDSPTVRDDSVPSSRRSDHGKHRPD